MHDRPHKSLWILKYFASNSKSSLLLKRAHFLSHPVLGICANTRVRTSNLCRNCVHTKYGYVQEKEYCGFLVLLSVLFVLIFLHTTYFDHST